MDQIVLSDEQLEAIQKIKETANKIPVFFTANMSLGVNLLCSLAKSAAKILEIPEGSSWKEYSTYVDDIIKRFTDFENTTSAEVLEQARKNYPEEWEKFKIMEEERDAFFASRKMTGV